jgi:thioredoxin reductase (NADPH)
LKEFRGKAHHLPQVLCDSSGHILTREDLLQDTRFPSVWPLERSPLMMETSLPGVFAIGDVRSSSLKRVAAAVGDGSIAIQYIHQYFALQHTQRSFEL